MKLIENIFLLRFRTAILIFSGSLFLCEMALSQDQRSEAIEAFRKEAQSCKTSPNQEILFDLVLDPGKPFSVPATPEEEAKVKDVLIKGNRPYDKVKNRATYEFVLSMIRAKNVGVFKVSSTDKSEDLTDVRDCLSKMSESGGLEYRFE